MLFDAILREESLIRAPTLGHTNYEDGNSNEGRLNYFTIYITSGSK